MSMTQEEPTLQELLSRVAVLEQANARLHEELTSLRAERAPAAEEQISPQTRPRSRRSSRRKMLTKGLGVAVATMGAGTLLELSGGTASAVSTKPGDFASTVAGTPAVNATGKNGADGVDALSDSGVGVSATSGSGTGLLARSSTGLAGHFVGKVQLDNALTVAGTLLSGAGTLASNGPPAVTATGSSGAEGVNASSDSGIAVFASSTSGAALVAKSASGLAGHFEEGDVQMDNNLTVAGTLSSGAGTFASVITTDGVVARSDSATGLLAKTISGLAGHFEGDVQMDNNLTIASALSTGTLSSGAGIFHGTSGITIIGKNDSGTGVLGENGSGGSGVSGSSGGGDGVLGETSNGNAVHGRIVNNGTGLAGFFEGNVQVNGTFSASGTKNFVQAHPTDRSKEIVYVALEGGEAGTYVRGSGTLLSGKAVLALPEHFGLVTAAEDLTIQLTPRGQWLQLYVAELDTAQLVVREAQGKSGAFDYFICGVRRGYEQYEVIRTKR